MYINESLADMVLLRILHYSLSNVVPHIHYSTLIITSTTYLPSVVLAAPQQQHLWNSLLAVTTPWAVPQVEATSKHDCMTPLKP